MLDETTASRRAARVLEEHAAPNMVTQTVLTTHLPRNVVFYRRHGFELTSERTLHPPRSHVYTIWSMRRASGSARGR
jgi:hypothetical protein